MPEEKECKFCKQLREAKANFEYYANKRHSMKEDCSTKCAVALVDNHYFRGEYSGRASYEFDELKFCPLCARPLAREELEW